MFIYVAPPIYMCLYAAFIKWCKRQFKRRMIHLPRFKNFGFFNSPSKTSQYGDTNATKIKIKAINVKLTATRRFLLWAPILLIVMNETHWIAIGMPLYRRVYLSDHHSQWMCVTAVIVCVRWINSSWNKSGFSFF